MAVAHPDANGSFTVEVKLSPYVKKGTLAVGALGSESREAFFVVTEDGLPTPTDDPPPQVQNRPPSISSVETFREGDLVFFRVFYTDPDGDAEGFGFRGANGAGWAEESHPFFDPSYGRVSPGTIEYPFNHACDSGPQYESDVEVWIYDSAGQRSPSRTVHLACNGGAAASPPPQTTQPPPQTTQPPPQTTQPRFHCITGPDSACEGQSLNPVPSGWSPPAAPPQWLTSPLAAQCLRILERLPFLNVVPFSVIEKVFTDIAPELQRRNLSITDLEYWTIIARAFVNLQLAEVSFKDCREWLAAVDRPKTPQPPTTTT